MLMANHDSNRLSMASLEFYTVLYLMCLWECLQQLQQIQGYQESQHDSRAAEKGAIAPATKIMIHAPSPKNLQMSLSISNNCATWF